uniref:acylphosphatase n=1 Tax=Catagonus wagneri TaxID=51154 RepID=A0A8C3W4Q1_9CETA
SEHQVFVLSSFYTIQEVFFCKYTQVEGKKLGLGVWVQNTDQGTAPGQLQGPISKGHHMQEQLETRGIPKSHINRANFSNEKVTQSWITWVSTVYYML